MSARFFCYPASQTVPTRVISAHVPMATARWSLFQQVAAERDRYAAALDEIVEEHDRRAKSFTGSDEEFAGFAEAADIARRARATTEGADA